MRSELVNYLDSRLGFQSDPLKIYTRVADEVEEGILRTKRGWYPILRGVPCFLNGVLRPDLRDFEQRHGLTSVATSPASESQHEQAKTNVTFSDKWSRFRNYGLES